MMPEDRQSEIVGPKGPNPFADLAKESPGLSLVEIGTGRRFPKIKGQAFLGQLTLKEHPFPKKKRQGHHRSDVGSVLRALQQIPATIFSSHPETKPGCASFTNKHDQST